METTTMSIKELHKNLKIVPDMVANGEEILVLKNSKPAFLISSTKKRNINEKKYTFSDLLKSQKYTGDKNLSKDIDTYLY